MVVAYLAVVLVPVAELAGVVVSTHVDFAVFCEKHRVVASCNARHLGCIGVNTCRNSRNQKESR